MKEYVKVIKSFSNINNNNKLRDLTLEEIKSFIDDIFTSEFMDSDVKSLLNHYKNKPITPLELTYFQREIFNKRKSIEINCEKSVDLCGTGGDGKNTFNISTISGFILAGAGIKVTKHGNYSATSLFGSSNVLESVGVKLTSEEKELKKNLEISNLCYLHAPLFYPFLKNISSIRKKVGFRTVFNLLGPLLNPINPYFQMIGVSDIDTFNLYSEYTKLTKSNFLLVHTVGGYDEISLTDDFITYNGNEKKHYNLKDLKISKILPKDILCPDDPDSNAKIFKDILNNKGTEVQQNVVIANAAFAIYGYYKEKSIEDCFLIAKESLVSGSANKSFEKLINSNI